MHVAAPRPTTRPAGTLRRRLVAAAAVAAASVGLVACGSDSGTSSGSGGRMTVVATTSQLGDIVREVGGDAVDVHQVLQPNTDPHEYEPRPVDVTETAGAKVVFASGLGLDGWISDVAKQSGGDAPVVTVGDGVPTKLAGDEHAEEEHGDEHAQDEHAEAGHDHEGDTDPHWWHDPTNVEAAVGIVRDALVQADPSAADAVRRSAAAYLAKVRALDARIRECVAAVPEAERKLVTSHDAFGYFAHRYGITVVGAAIPSQTTRAQPSAGQVAALTKLIEREKVKAIFPESSVNPKLADAIGKETGASSDLTLYGDTLGEQGSDGATYIGMEQHNADAVVRGFTGKADGCTFPR
ncbi:metal ABC transporter substrate-binding protein [Patulibacter minatonensis]|uniref:metal ABC transporter substrate-binding protein n=1 Tax=Patulibacter minatonensis TaxID=298163 RepID=UPI0004B4646C|nr:metal ABC transporter substrate-binding protein [Patulibacter minatonensis]